MAKQPRKANTRRLFPLDTPDQQRAFRRSLLGIAALMLALLIVLYNLPIWLAHAIP